MNIGTAKIVLVTGSRHWGWGESGKLNPAERERLYVTLKKLHDAKGIGLVVNGGAKGADEMSSTWAKIHYVPHLIHPANWPRDSKAAGPLRNQAMLDYWEPDLVIAFHNDLDESKGTKDMVERAIKAALPTYHYTAEGRKQAWNR